MTTDTPTPLKHGEGVSDASTQTSGGVSRARLTAILPSGVIFVGLCIYLFGIVLYPLAKLVETAIRSTAGRFTGSYLVDVLTAPGLASAIAHSLIVAFVVTIVATTLGAVLAWLVTRTNMPGRKTLRWLLITPFVIPPFVAADAWLSLFGGSDSGWLNQLGTHLPLVSGDLWDVNGPDGIIFVLILTTYPLAYITVLGTLNRLDTALEESARASGASVRTTLRTVTLPVMWPAIASGAVLVFVYTVADFGVAATLGFGDNYYLMTTRIYALLQNATQPGSINQAAALSILLALIGLIAVVMQRLSQRLSGGRISRRSGVASDVPLLLARGRYGAAAFCWLVAFVAGFMPLGAILLTAISRSVGRAPLPGNFTLGNFRSALFADSATLVAARNSLILSVLAATIISIVGALIAYISHRTRIPGRGLFDAVGSFPYVLPGTVVAVGALLAFLRPVAGVSLFDTLWIILVGYLIHYMAYGIRATSGALSMIDDSMEEAARACGAGQLRTFTSIVLPMLRPALVGGFILVLIPTMRELTISILLWGPGTQTIGVVVYNLQSTGSTQASAAVAVLLVAIVGVANALSRRLSGGSFGY